MTHKPSERNSEFLFREPVSHTTDGSPGGEMSSADSPPTGRGREGADTEASFDPTPQNTKQNCFKSQFPSYAAPRAACNYVLQLA